MSSILLHITYKKCRIRCKADTALGRSICGSESLRRPSPLHIPVQSSHRRKY